MTVRNWEFFQSPGTTGIAVGLGGEVDPLRLLKRRGSLVVADIPGKGTYYRVRVGRFAGKDEADRYLVDFKRETGMDGFVTQVGR